MCSGTQILSCIALPSSCRALLLLSSPGEFRNHIWSCYFPALKLQTVGRWKSRFLDLVLTVLPSQFPTISAACQVTHPNSLDSSHGQLFTALEIEDWHFFHIHLSLAHSLPQMPPPFHLSLAKYYLFFNIHFKCILPGEAWSVSQPCPRFYSHFYDNRTVTHHMWAPCRKFPVLFILSLALSSIW